MHILYLYQLIMFTEKGMHFLEVYNRLNQLQTSNILKTATSTELQTIGPSNYQINTLLHIIIDGNAKSV